MKKKITALILSALMCVGILALPISAAEEVMKYAPSASVTPMFDNVTSMVDGIAGVMIGNKWGYIDEMGRLFIAPKYDIAFPMYNGRAVVGYASSTAKVSGGEKAYDLYVVDRLGNEKQLRLNPAYHNFGTQTAELNGGLGRDGLVSAVLRFDPTKTTQYSKVYFNGDIIVLEEQYLFSSDGTPIVVTDPWGLLGNLRASSTAAFYFNPYATSNAEVIPMYAWDESAGASIAFYITHSGQVVRKFDSYSNPLSYYSAAQICAAWQPIDGYITVAVNTTDSTGKSVLRYGVLNSMGQYVVPPIYTDVAYENGITIRDGMICLYNENGRCGVVSVADGSTIIPFLYDDIGLMGNGYAVGYVGVEAYIIDKNHSSYKVVDEKGKAVSLKKVGEMKENGLRFVITSDDRTFLIDDKPVNGVFTALRGTEKLKLVEDSFNNGTYWVTRDSSGKKYGFVKLELAQYIDLNTYTSDNAIVNALVKVVRKLNSLFVWSIK